MRPVKLASAFANPEHVCGAVVPVTACGVASRERLFVTEQQRFVACPHVDLAKVAVGIGIHADGAHEAKCPIDLGCHVVVTLALFA